MAYRNEDVRALNELARAQRVAQSELGPAYVVATETGPSEFAVGDRAYSGKNDRLIGVTDGSLGTLIHCETGPAGDGITMAVKLDSGRYVAVNLDSCRSCGTRAHVDSRNLQRPL